jgi:hypothetical protein
MAETAQAQQQWDQKSDVVENLKMHSGFEGNETALGTAISVVLKQLGNHAGYAHELNDPLVKAHLMAIDFARANGKLDEYVAHDVKMMEPINQRMKNLIDKTGKKEIALVGLFDRTACPPRTIFTKDGPDQDSWVTPNPWALNSISPTSGKTG